MYMYSRKIWIFIYFYSKLLSTFPATRIIQNCLLVACLRNRYRIIFFRWFSVFVKFCASYSAHVEFRNKRLWTAVFNNNGQFCQLIKIIACKESLTRRFQQCISNATISFPLSRLSLPIYCKFFYMQTKPLSNNMPNSTCSHWDST